MPTAKQVRMAFNAWNLHGKGKNTLRSGNWFYRDDVLFYQDMATARWVTTANQKAKVRLQKVHHSIVELAKTMTDSDSKERYASWRLPELGVKSHYPGDLLDDGDLHLRQLHYMRLQLINFIDENVTPEPMPDLEKGRDWIVANAKRHYERYDNYKSMFGLPLMPPLPPMYLKHIEAEIERRIALYHSPKSVTARERTKARAIAKKALGIA